MSTMTDSIVRDLLNVHVEPGNVYVNIKCLAKMTLTQMAPHYSQP